MKKYLITCTLCLSLIVLFCMNVYAAESEDTEMKVKIEDSLKFSYDTINQVDIAEGEKIVKVYNITPPEAFAECSTIEEIISKWALPSFTYYYVISNDVTVRQIIRLDGLNGKIRESFVPSDSMRMKNRYTLPVKEIINNEGIKRVSSEIEISNVYYLDGEMIPGDGVVVYYETNLGKYVYYYQMGEEYVIPLERFVEMMKEVAGGRGPDSPPTSNISVSTLFDLSEFNIKSETFNVKANPLSDNNVTQNQNVDNKTAKLHLKELVCGIALFACVSFAVLAVIYTIKSKKLNVK